MPPMICDDEVVDQVIAAAEKIIGKENIHSLANPSLGSEDFSYMFPAVGQGMQFSLGGAIVTFLSPEAHKSYENVNNRSLVVRVDYGSVSFLFTGDVMENAELDMLRSGVNLNADVLKVAHHGADTSSGMDFLRAVSPQVAVVSCGADLQDHPGQAAMERLQKTAGLILRTDVHGEIALFTDGQTLTYVTENP